MTSSYGPDDIERWAAEPPKRSGRTPFQRDRARVLHSSALRRLAAKTQVVEVGQAVFDLIPPQRRPAMEARELAPMLLELAVDPHPTCR